MAGSRWPCCSFLAMVTLTAGLICFLREIYLATRYLRIGESEPERTHCDHRYDPPAVIAIVVAARWRQDFNMRNSG